MCNINGTEVVVRSITLLIQFVVPPFSSVPLPLQHYKMKRHTTAAGLCYSGRRTVSVTQNRFADCVTAITTTSDTICFKTVSFQVAPSLF